MKLLQTICVPLDHDNDVLVISPAANRDDGQHVRIKVVEGDQVAATEINLDRLLDLLQAHMGPEK